MATLAEERRMLWRGLEDASHVSVLGSFHLFDGPLPDWLLQALDAADRVVFESDTSKALPLPSLPRGKSLKSLSVQVGRRALAVAEQLGLNPDYVNRLYPWAAALQIGLRVIPENMQWEHGPEHVLRRLAYFQRKRCDFLETFEEHYKLHIREVPIQEQISGLVHSLDRLESAPETLRLLLESWRRGDIESIWPISKYSELEEICPNIVAGMLTKRHELWLPRVADLIRESANNRQRILLVVGCLHLSGPYSLFSWLKSEGYGFQQIQVDSNLRWTASDG